MAEQTGVRMSLADFMRRSRERRFEWIDGEIIEMTPTKKAHSKITKRMYDALRFHLATHDAGEVFFETTFIIEDSTDCVKGARIPDVSFYARERYDQHEADNPDDADKPFILVPDLVVETISPTDKYTNVERKIRADIRDGVRLLWIVDPDNQQIKIYAGTLTPQRLDLDATLTGGAVLPQFSLAVRTTFA